MKTMREIMESIQQIDEGSDAQEATVVFYNAGHGESPAKAAKDESRVKKITNYDMRMGSNGMPQLGFEHNGNTIVADWNADIGGWVVNLD